MVAMDKIAPIVPPPDSAISLLSHKKFEVI